LSHVALLRIHAGHTQASLAAAAGVSERTILRLEKGARPSAGTAVKVTRALGHTDPLVVFAELLDR
jgi:DNA-binding XRE family transcriptional regulator